jgi:putative adhesin
MAYQHQTDPYGRGSMLSRSFLPLALITLGVVFLLGNLVPERGRAGLFVLGLGAAFLVGRLTTGRYGYAVPAGILMAIGAYISLQDLGGLRGMQGAGAFFVLLGLGFALAYAIGLRPWAIWPLFPATILVGLGLALLGISALGALSSLSWIAAYWPAALVLLGVWLLVRDSVPSSARRPIATLGGLALLAYGILAAAASMATGGALARGGVSPGFGSSPFSDSVTLEAPIAAGQTFHVDNSSGRTTIHASSGSTVHVEAARHYNLGGQPPEVRLMPQGDGVRLEASSPRARFPFGDSSSVDYTIELPAGVNVRAQSSSGNLSVSDVAGEVRLATSSGRIDTTGLSHLREATTSSGSMSLEGVFTEAAQVRSSSGTVNLKLLPGSAVQLDIRSSSGSVVPQGSLFLTGGATQRTSLTGALGTPAQGAVLSVQTSSGSVLISQ